MDKYHWISCDCKSCEHTVCLSYFNDDDEFGFNPIYMSTSLIRRPNFLKRIWYAIKYIFGYRCKYGHFDETLINREEVNKLISFLNSYETDQRLNNRQ